MKLLELLDKAKGFEVLKNTKELYKASFMSNNRAIIFTAGIAPGSPDGFWSVDFVEHDGEKTTHKATGSGGEFEVFATIKVIMKAFIDEKQPKVIDFSAEKDGTSRANLYTRMIKKFKAPGYKADVNKNTDYRVYYTLVKE